MANHLIYGELGIYYMVPYEYTENVTCMLRMYFEV